MWDQLLATLSNLFNLAKIATITLPGLICSIALIVFFWPSTAIDLAPIPSFFGDQQTFDLPPLTLPSYPNAFGRTSGGITCKVRLTKLGVDGDELADLLDIDSSFWTHQIQSVRDQLLLEVNQLRILECIERENNIKAILEKIKPVPTFELVRSSERMALLRQYSDLIAERLKDSNRLHHQVAFDFFISGLINHLTGFLILTLCAGVIVSAINKGLWEIVL